MDTNTPTGAAGGSSDLRTAAQDIAQDAKDGITALRGRAEALVNDRVMPTVAQAAGQAEAFAGQARVQLRQGSEALEEKVREQPLLALGVAALFGFLLAALFRR